MSRARRIRRQPHVPVGPLPRRDRQRRHALRGAVALLFNVLMVVVAMIAIIMTVPGDDRREAVNV